MSSDLSNDLTRLILDGTKIQYYQERIAQWKSGMRIPPITIDMSLTRACNYSCNFCFSMMQENERKPITKQKMFEFIDDCAEMGVLGISFVSDGESTLHPDFVEIVEYGHSKGIAMASGTNGYLLDEKKLQRLLPALTYLRFNFSAGEKKRYEEIMGSKPGSFERVCENIKTATRIKKERGLKCTIGMQMVFDPRYHDQVLPLARLGKELRPDYLILKHCSDDEDGFLGVDYGAYKSLYGLLEEAEAMSDETYLVQAKWGKIKAAGKRSYQRCYGTPFLLQISGSGLIAPCGPLFNERYKKYHIGNIATDRFKDIIASDRYWEVVSFLASDDFDAQKMCSSLCLQNGVNTYLDNLVKGKIQPKEPDGEKPIHLEFV